jgi:hypothetical protein
MDKKINPKLSVGDRIICLDMAEEPSMIGQKGTITKVHDRLLETLGLVYDVNWDNGSKLTLLNTDYWTSEKNMKNMKNIEESFEREFMDKIMANKDVFKMFDLKFLFSFLEKLRESSVINMFGASPYLYMGKDKIEHQHYYNESKNEEAFDEMVEMSDEAKNKMIQGTLKVLKSQNKEITIDNVNKYVRIYSKKILDMWMTTY